MSPEILPNEFFDPGSISIPGGIETIIGTSQSALDQFQQLGLSTHAIVGTIFIGGLLLWLFGGKSLKIGFGLLGMLVGAQVGLIVPAAIGYDTPPIIVAVTGGALGLLVGIVAFRFTVAWTMAVLLGSLGLIGAGAYFEVRPEWTPSPEAEISRIPESQRTPEEQQLIDELRRLRDEAFRDLADERGFLPQPDNLPDDPEARERYERRVAAAEEGAQRLSEVFREVREQLRPSWERLPTQEKSAIIAISLVGAILGFAVGLLATKKSAMLITAFAGPLIWVPSGFWLAAAMDLPGLSHLPTQPLVWALVWIVLSVAGLLIQWRRPKE